MFASYFILTGVVSFLYSYLVHIPLYHLVLLWTSSDHHPYLVSVKKRKKIIFNVQKLINPNTCMHVSRSWNYNIQDASSIIWHRHALSLPSAQKNRFLRALGPASVNSTVKASSLLIAMCLICLLNVQLYRGRFKKKCKFTFWPKKAPH